MNKRKRGALILERLDRIVANYEWLNFYPEAHVQYLPRIHSNHCPLLLALHKNTPPRNNIFILKIMWLTHQEFPQLVDQIWNNNPHLLEAIENFTTLVKIWKKDSFGNIFYKENNIKA